MKDLLNNLINSATGDKGGPKVENCKYVIDKSGNVKKLAQENGFGEANSETQEFIDDIILKGEDGK